MNVIFIARNFPPIVGGAEKLNSDIAQNLGELVHLKVITNKWDKYSPIFHIYSLFKVLLDKKIDLIFLSDAFLSPLIPIFKIFKRKPIVIKVNGLDISYPNRFYQFFVPKFTNMADRIICISSATKEECMKRGIIKNKTEVIPVGVSDSLYLKEDKNSIKNELEKRLNISLNNKKILLSVGRLVERKGFYWFVENVIQEILKTRRDFLYLIVGDGILKEKISRIIQENNLKEYVKLFCKIDDKFLKLFYNSADIFIMPNIPVKGDIEGFGIVVLEAASCGLPVVASKVEGIKDTVIDGKNGFLVNSFDTDGYVRKISELLSDNLFRREFGTKAREFVKRNYNWRRISRGYLNEFVNLLEI